VVEERGLAVGTRNSKPNCLNRWRRSAVDTRWPCDWALDRPVVACVARITRQKGLGYLLDAARFLDPAVRLVLRAGRPTPPEEADEFRARIAGTTHHQGHVERVHDVGGIQRPCRGGEQGALPASARDDSSQASAHSVRVTARRRRARRRAAVPESAAVGSLLRWPPGKFSWSGRPHLQLRYPVHDTPCDGHNVT
jgi:hypothetical protein